MALPTYKKDSFLFFKYKQSIDSIYDEGIIIENGRIEKTVRYINEKGIKSLIINPLYSKIDDLSFINDLNCIDSIRILNDADISSIKIKSKIRELRIDKFLKKVDFEEMPNLEILGCTYSSKILNLSSCKKLLWLWLDNYSEIDFESLRGLEKLMFLTFVNPKFRQLLGVSSLRNLKELHIDNAKNLESLVDFSHVNYMLTFLDIFKAPKLSDYDAIANLKGLQRLRITKAGDIKDLSILDGLVHLDMIALGLKVIDGDMSILKKINEVSFVDYPHYNIKSKFFRPS